MKPNDLVSVTCESCGNSREIKWSALKDKKQLTPYKQKCKSCGSKRVMSEETKKKISESLFGKPTSAETRAKISEYRKNRPELWVTLRPELGRGKRTMPHSEEAKAKISETMKETLKQKKENKDD